MRQAYRRITPPQPCDDLPDYCGWTENAHLIGLWRAGRAATEGRRVTQALLPRFHYCLFLLCRIYYGAFPASLADVPDF